MKPDFHIEGITFRRVTAADASLLAGLFARTYGTKRSCPDFSLKLKEEEQPHFCFAAFDADGRAVSHFGMYHRTLTYKGQQFRALVHGDVMTDKEYLRMGLVQECCRLGMDASIDSGVAFMFAFPNRERVVPLLRHFQMTSHNDLQALTLHVATVPFAKLFRSNFLLRFVFNAYVDLVVRVFFKSGDMFQNSEVVVTGIGVQHDDVFFRQQQHSPTIFLQSGKYSYWLKADGWLRVGDIRFVEDAMPDEIVYDLKRVAMLLGCNQVLLLTSPDSHLCKLLGRHMQRNTSHPICMKSFNSEIDNALVRFNYGDEDTF